MIDLAVFLASLVGFGLLMGAMPRHQQDWLRRKLSPRRSHACRWAGFGLIALAYAIAGAGFGWGYGAIAWLGWLTVAAALVVALHTNRERLLGKARR